MSHVNKIYDADPHFTINPINRQIKNESSSKTTLIQGDHNSERFSFCLDRLVEGHDMMECNRVEIHFNNNDFEDVYEVEDLQIKEDDESKIAFSWLLSGNATQNEGRLEFSIRFACVDGEGNVEYSWNTAIHNGISISKGMNNAEAVVEKCSDAIAQLESKLADKVNEKADKTALDNKADKLKNDDTVNLIYAVNTKNKMIGLRNTHGSSANSIPLRGTDHDLRVRLNPTYENEAVPKKYVDDAVKKVKGGIANIGDTNMSNNIGYMSPSDLDDVKTPGIYIFTSSYGGGAHILSVYDYIGYMQSPIVQTLYPDGLYRIYGNAQEDDSYPSEWSEWKEVDEITEYV